VSRGLGTTAEGNSGLARIEQSALVHYRFIRKRPRSNIFMILSKSGGEVRAISGFSGTIDGFQVEVYPQSNNVYDSLAEAYMVNGDRELAIKNYEKSLELNPKNSNAVEMLKKLRKE